MKIKRKGIKAQEEMVGFALIVIIISIILVVFLAISLRKVGREPVESYKVEGFVNALLQYNTGCEDKRNGFLPVRELIYSCYVDNNKLCLNGNKSCDILNKVLNGTLNASWPVGQDTSIKGYVFNISRNGSPLPDIPVFDVGDKTSNSFGASEKLPKDLDIIFSVYY